MRGRDRILALQPVLRDLAAMTGQPGEADDLAFFLLSPDALRKDPVLVLSRAGPGEPSVRNLKDAALLFEYRVLGRGLRIFASEDATGRRTVFAAAHKRAVTAASAAAALLAEGAHLVHLAFQPKPDGLPQSADEHDEASVRRELPAAVHWSLTRRPIPLYLPLGPTFSSTLARIGQRTRSNLRYYRRRTEREIGCVYQPEVRIHLREFLSFNRTCMYAVPDALATWRFQALKSIRDPLLAGIQDREGRWLALAGGRRRGPEVEIDWQMNRADRPQLSLSTVLRSCLIEAEIARGSQRLYIEGGTPQPIGRAFIRRPVAELTVKRDSTYVRLLTRFAGRLLPEKNYIGQLLTEPTLHWQRQEKSST